MSNHDDMHADYLEHSPMYSRLYETHGTHMSEDAARGILRAHGTSFGALREDGDPLEATAHGIPTLALVQVLGY